MAATGEAPTTGLDLDTLEMVLSSIRQFAHARLGEDVLLGLDARDEMPLETVRDMCAGELGIQLLFIQEEYGGLGGGAFDVYRVCEEMARIDLGIATGVLATFLGSDPIRVGGTPEQRKRWMTAIGEQGLLMAYAATEPEAGSDLAALRTTAEHVMDGDRVAAYRINGRKQWISNGGVADLYSVLANAPGGPSWFVVDRGTPGLSAGRQEDKHGIRASNTAAVYLDGVEVATDRLVGGTEGQGLLQAQAVFGYTRLMVAAFGLGAGWAALDRAIAYSTGRTVGGSPLSEKQGYTHRLVVPHAARLEAARAYIEETATRLDRAEGGLNTEGAIAKYLASEAGNAAADAAIQAHGGYGYTREYLVEKIRRDVRITTIYEGTSEIMEMTIARERWQSHLKTRGDHYHQQARALEALDATHPTCGAGTAALANHALAEILERAREQRLTRSQHVLLRLGELIAYAEGTASLARRAAAAADGELHPKADRRFDPDAIATLSRIAAREAALTVAAQGLRWISGAGDAAGTDLAASVGMPAIHAAQAGLAADMNRTADVIYDRPARPEGDAGSVRG
jgi:alkylation response protein AidB-like acyl-CoA dehydrogenase